MLMYDLQKANLWKRISAFLFDSIMLGIVIVGMALLFSTLFNYDGYTKDLNDLEDHYYEKYDINPDMSQEEADALTEEEIAAYMKDDANCILTFILTMEDGREMTYRFFPYSERHAMVSLSGDGIEGVTVFYTNAAAVRRIATAAHDLMHGVYIDSEHRYSET